MASRTGSVGARIPLSTQKLINNNNNGCLHVKINFLLLLHNSFCSIPYFFYRAKTPGNHHRDNLHQQVRAMLTKAFWHKTLTLMAETASSKKNQKIIKTVRLAI
jgi:hypothetical protein